MNNKEEVSKSIFKRLKIYTDEMFPVVIYFPFLVALYLCMNFTVQAVSGNDIVFDSYCILGFISAFFIMLMMRTFDDLKDFELDNSIFPDRAIPRGLVLKSDLKKLAFFCLAFLVVTNILFGLDTLIVFMITMVYALLTYKWFFSEKIHRDNLFLTMADHQPLPYVINWYLLHTALASGENYDSFTIDHFYLLLIFSLPITAWEISRKVRAPEKEDNYESFSLVIGLKPATIIPWVLLLISGFLSINLGNFLGFSMLFYIITCILMLIVTFFYLRFLIYPKDKYNVLLNVTMLFTALLFLNIIGHLLSSSVLSISL